MSKIRIPATQVPLFKTFCKLFASHFEKTTGVRLRGNNLLNLLARSAGHDSYTALLIDSGTYGDGNIAWESIPNHLSNHISVTTGVSLELCLHALTMSLREVQQANRTVGEEPSPTETEIAHTMPLAPYATGSEGLPAQTYGNLFADSADIAEMEWEDILKTSETPLIDLTQLESDKLDINEKMALCKLVANNYKNLPPHVRCKVVIHGNNETIKWFLDASGLDTSEIEKIILKQNPSLKSRLVSVSFATSDISQFEGASEAELSAIAANTRFKIPMTDETISCGERFAERKRPTALMKTEQHLIEALEIAKNSLSPVQVQAGSYDLNQLSNSVYQLLPTTNGFSSLDVAGWILDNGRKYGVSVTHRPLSVTH